MGTESKKPLIRCIFGVYIIGVLSITFIVRETMILRTPENRGVILEPFREWDAMLHQPEHLFWFMQIFLNILLFVPFGALLPCAWKRSGNMWATVITGLLFSAVIETLQYVTERGMTEIDDVINNTIGTAAGYLIYAAVRWLFRRHTRIHSDTV